MSKRRSRIQIISIAGSILPILWFTIGWLGDRYSPYPTLFLIQFSGTYALIFLLISLSCTPIRTLFSIPAMNQARKVFGLTSFYYASMHAFSFTVLDYQLNLEWLIPEFQNKPYLLLGLTAVILLLILAVTSITKVQERLAKTWLQIHKVVYLIVGFVLIHQYFAIKGDKREALIYIVIYSILMILRIPFVNKNLKLSNCKRCKDLNNWLIS